jgi:hypothetical protein
LRRLARIGPALALVTLALLPFVFHWRLFARASEERTMFRGDFLNQHYVWKSYALSRVAKGELPLWNPHVLGGVAFHANPQVALFYPPTYLLLPFQVDGHVSYLALEAYQLLHQVFAGLGMWLLMRSFGVSNLGAMFAGIVFAFTGFFTTPGHHAIVVTASWMAWVLLAVKRALTSDTVAPTGAAALVIAAMILAGHPQVAYYGILLALTFALVTGGVKRACMRIVPAAVLALGISAVQLFPTYQLAQESSRADLGYEYSTSFAASPYLLPSIFVPRAQIRLPGQDDAAPLHLYAGIGTLLLAAVGLMLSPQRWRLFFAASAVVALFLSFGDDSPLFDWFYAAVPGFKSFRVPYRLLGVYTLGVAVLAGLGVHALENASRKTRVRLRGLLKAAFVVLALLALWVAYLHSSAVTTGTLEPQQLERLVGGGYWAVLLGVLNVVLVAYLVWRPKEKWVLPCLVAVTIVDLGAFVKDRGERPYRTISRAGERRVHSLVRSQDDRSRYVSESNLENYAILHGVDFAGGHSALVDARYAELLHLSHSSANALALLNTKFIARGAPPSAYPWCGSRFASPLPLIDIVPEIAPVTIRVLPPVTASSFRLDWRPLGEPTGLVIELAGTTHRLEPGAPLEVRFDQPETIGRFSVRLETPSDGVSLESIEIDLNPLGLKADFLAIDGVKVNLHALPRAYFMVPSPVPAELQTLESLRCWSVHEGVQVQDVVTGEGASGFFRKDAARILIYQPERVELETRSPRDGFVVLADTFRPGWIAEVDGVESPILRAQWTMRAVAVPAGEHRVVFRYRPESLRSGAIATGASLLMTLALLATPWILRRKERLEAPPPPDDDFVASP